MKRANFFDKYVDTHTHTHTHTNKICNGEHPR